MRKREKLWYIRLEGKEEGPYSFMDLKSDPRITPEVDAKKKEWADWVPIGEISELSQLFADPCPLEDTPAVKKPSFRQVNSDDEIAISFDPQNPLFLLLLLLVLLLAFISFLQLI